MRLISRLTPLAFAFAWACASSPSEPISRSDDETPVVAQPAAVDPATLVAFEGTDGLWGYRDESGRTVLPAIYPVASGFGEEGLAAVVVDDRWAYIDVEGTVVFHPFPYDNGPDMVSEGLVRFVDNGQVGFCRPSGEVVVAAAFDFATPFREGRAAVCVGCRSEPVGPGSEYHRTVGGRWGYIDRAGGTVVPLALDAASAFLDGSAEVVLDGKPLTIDLAWRLP